MEIAAELVVIVLASLLIESALAVELCSNVLIEFKGVPTKTYVHYTIKPIKPGRNVKLIKGDEISLYLRHAKFGKHTNWWGLDIKKKLVFDSSVYERNILTPMRIYNDTTRYYKNESNSFLDQSFICNGQRTETEIETILIGGTILPNFMRQYGCKNSRIADKINKNIVYLILFKGDPLFKINIDNSTLHAFRFRKGILKVANIGIKNKTHEENEIIFNHLVDYCEKVASIRKPSYVSKFEKAFDMETIIITDKAPERNFKIPIIIFSLVAIIIIIDYADQIVFN
ncbi:unnamed protein product [Diamesa tonsa]